MKILLYAEGLKTIGKSGLGKAIQHQMKALEDEKIEYTLNPKDDYDILHINTYFLKSYLLAKKQRDKEKKLFIMLILQKRTIKMDLFLENKLRSFLNGGL